MPPLRPLHPPEWAVPKGYANGMAVTLQPGSQFIVTGGQIGWNAQQEFESDDFIDQCRLALLNVRAVLQTAGAGPEHICRLNWYITRRDEYLRRTRELGVVYRDVLGRHYPAMACLEVSALIEARAQVEIEATAIIP